MATGCDMRHNDSVKLLKQFSRQSSDGECSVEEELELLQNVYLQEELELVSSQKGHVVLKFHVTPSTADDKTQQFVYMDIIVSLSHEVIHSFEPIICLFNSISLQYPIAIPKVAFKESRGLSDAHLQSISDGVRHMSLEHQGSPMIYDLVEFVKDCLTDNNRPCGQCAICQINFQEDDEFVRTDCYHYYHPPCLSRYVKFCEQQRREEDEEQRRTGQNRWSAGSKPKSLECPVCRAPITTFLSPCIEEEEKECPSSVELSPELIKWQKEMALLYEKQLAKGGIVNTQEQDDTIDETWVSIRKENEETDKLICDEKKTKEKRSSLAAGNHRRSHSRQKRHHKGSSQGSDSPHQTRNGQIDKRRNGGSGREARGRPRQDAQELVGDDTKREEHSDSNDRKPSPLQLDRVKVQPITHSDQDKKTRTHQNASVHQQSWTVDSSSASPAAQRPSRAEDRLECKNTKDCRRTNIVINVGSRPRQTSAHSKREHV